MKNLFYLFIALALFGACTEETCTETFFYYEPIYLSQEELNEINFEGVRAISNAGKIYAYNNLLLINEVKKGIHFIDNSNQKDPKQIGFLSIPGNVDMAVKNNILYADGYKEMMAFDISTPSNPIKVNSIPDAFNHTLYFDQSVGKFLVDYTISEMTEIVDCNAPELSIFTSADALASAGGGMSANNNLTAAGQAGSFARFTLDGDYLYAVNTHSILTYDVSSPSELENIGSTSIGWGIETIFPYKDYFFIGANDGLYIYDKTNPAEPQYVSKFVHANACDPVVVQNDIAYVTLRSGTDCQGFTNQLEVLDVSEITNPILLSTHSMDNPHGLGVVNDNIFICDGNSGVKVFDKSDHTKISERLLAQIKDHFAYDIILLSNQTAIVLGKSDFYQYDISDISDIKLLSTIEYYPV